MMDAESVAGRASCGSEQILDDLLDEITAKVSKGEPVDVTV